ncbi:MAG: cellulase family glycosylhydrolase [Lachnospiraceae bacterium]|nr:cellulase family glycosylhydrolase [Lachnospiraceae bacterium]
MRELFDRSRVTGFLHADGQIMVNGNGEEVLLRGWGMGNWDNPEGFMIGATGFFGLPGGHSVMGRMDRGRALEQIVRETCGSKYLESFWDRWHRAWLSEADIRLLSERGYNSVRLPIRACSFLKEEPGIEWNECSFTMLNDVLDWCEKYRIYAIIDIHAATAAQSCIPCDDGVDNAPHFYTDEEAIDRMYILMEEFARRYKDREIVGAYDVMNEPLSMTQRNAELLPVLKDFYQEMVRRFRVIDKNHLILLNGTQFSSRLDIFDRDYDPECHNYGIALHAYAMVSPETVSFTEAFETSKKWNIPLWLGETGTAKEYAWQTTVYEIFREHHAGYNLWSFKTCNETGAAKVLYFDPPAEWQLIVDYALRGGPKPGFLHAQAIFDEFLKNASFENCREDPTYHPYLLREGDFEIPAIGYNDAPEEGKHSIRRLPSPANYRSSDGFSLVCEKGFLPPVAMPGAGRDGIHVRDHLLLSLAEGEYVSYTVLDPGTYSFGITYAADADVRLQLYDEEKLLTETVLPAAEETVPAPGTVHPLFPAEPAPNTLTTACLAEISGEHVLRLQVLQGSIRVGKILIRKA